MRNNYKNLIITKGKFGSYLFRKDKDFFCPAFVQNPDDTIGSGDAFFYSLFVVIIKNRT